MKTLDSHEVRFFFYMAGQWVEPGGMVPIVAMSGRNVIQMLCHRDRRPFVTTRA